MATPADTKFTYDDAFQTQIARALYQDSDFAAMMSEHLPPRLFGGRLNRWVVETVFKHVEKYGHSPSHDAMINYAEKAVDTGAVKRMEIEALSTCVSRLKRPVKDRSYIRDEVFNFVKAMKLQESVLAAVEHFDRNELAEADSKLDAYLNFRDQPKGLGHFYLGDIKKRMIRRRYYEANGIPTDTKIDSFFQPGGLPPKQLGCIIAPSGTGKTLALIHFARAAVMHNCQALYVTLELSEEVIQDRFDAAFSDLYISQLPHKRAATRAALAPLKERFKEALVIKEFAPQSLTVAGLRSYLRQLERVGFYPDLICVDYADNLLPSRHYDDAYTEMGLVYAELRALMIDNNIAGWTASQGNRASFSAKSVGLDSMADSIKKVFVCDVVLGLSQTEKEKRNKKARIGLLKNRNGSAGIEVTVKIEAGKQRIITMDDEEISIKKPPEPTRVLKKRKPKFTKDGE